jgi:hypothetical protein
MPAGLGWWQLCLDKEDMVESGKREVVGKELVGPLEYALLPELYATNPCA